LGLGLGSAIAPPFIVFVVSQQKIVFVWMISIIQIFKKKSYIKTDLSATQKRQITVEIK